MMNPILTLLLSALLASAQTASVPDRVRAIALNNPMEVRLQDGSKLRGWRGDVSESGFVLACENKHQLERREVASVMSGR